MREAMEDLLSEIHTDQLFDETIGELARLLLSYWTMEVDYR